MWEDPANRQGGKWMIRLRKGIASRYWEYSVGSWKLRRRCIKLLNHRSWQLLENNWMQAMIFAVPSCRSDTMKISCRFGIGMRMMAKLAIDYAIPCVKYLICLTFLPSSTSAMTHLWAITQVSAIQPYGDHPVDAPAVHIVEGEKMAYPEPIAGEITTKIRKNGLETHHGIVGRSQRIENVEIHRTTMMAGSEFARMNA